MSLKRNRELSASVLMTEETPNKYCGICDYNSQMGFAIIIILLQFFWAMFFASWNINCIISCGISLQYDCRVFTFGLRLARISSISHWPHCICALCVINVCIG